MKTIVIKWWSLAAASAGLVASAPADGADQWRATSIGGDLRFDPIRLELKPVPANSLVVRPDATIRMLIEQAGQSVGLTDRGPEFSHSFAGAAGDRDRLAAGPVAPAPAKRTVSVICVSGCEGLFGAAGRQPQRDAS